MGRSSRCTPLPPDPGISGNKQRQHHPHPRLKTSIPLTPTDSAGATGKPPRSSSSSGASREAGAMVPTAQTSGPEQARSPSYRRQPRPAPCARPHRPEFPRESLGLQGAAPDKLETPDGTRPPRSGLNPICGSRSCSRRLLADPLKANPTPTAPNPEDHRLTPLYS